MMYRYQLAPYAGKGSRIVCPSCGQNEFVPYIDTETGEIIDATCGRCNRETHCGYHLPPAEYFKQNPVARPRGDAWRQQSGYQLQQPYARKADVILSTPESKICELPKEIVEMTIRMEPSSNFVKFLDTILDPIVSEGVVFLYNLGVTKARETIFYQQDREGRYRGGKVIQYDPQTGHRIKDTALPVYWIHQSFLRNGHIAADWKMTQCLFGEHLLDRFPDSDVCLVESEKTACICAGLAPQFVWVATGGKTQLGERLNVLKGRKVIAYPDVDAYEDWKGYFEKHGELGVEVSDFVEKLATDEDRKNQVDVADLLIRDIRQG